MILIYSDSQIIDREWLTKLKFDQPIEITHSFVDYKTRTGYRKIAFTAHRLHTDYDLDCQEYKRFEDKVIQLSEISKVVFTLESELHHYHWGLWHRCHRDNVYWILPGYVNDSDMSNHLIFWGDWFKTTANLYKQLPHVQKQFKPFDVKPKYFDALLGSPKPHRTFIDTNIKEYQLDNKIISTYGGQWQNTEFYAKDYFIWEPGCEPLGTIIGTADAVKYQGVECHLSQVIPVDIYNQTAYSIIAETDHNNTLSFFSEKTAKPMIARRLFIAFSGYKFLENLRRLGFKTFDGIIDESYDQIKYDGDRYTAAFEQVRWLCDQDQQLIYNKIKPIVDHNYELLMSRDWTDYSIRQVQKVIDYVLVRPSVDVL